jgi:hypothetical protein
MKKTLLIILVTLLLSNISKAQDFNSDRLGFSESPTTVEKGHLQLETGLKLEDDGINLNTGSDILLRFGISEKLEIKTNLNLQYIGTFDNIPSLTFGGKYNFIEQNNIIPKVSASYYFNFPYMVKGRKMNPHLSNRILLSAQNFIGDYFSLCYNIGRTLDTTISKQLYITSMMLNCKIDEQWIVYIEHYNFISKYSKPLPFISLGCGYNVRENFQLNLNYNNSLTSEKVSAAVSVGLSYKF